MTIIELQSGARTVRVKLDEIACLFKSSMDLEIRLKSGVSIRLEKADEIEALWKRWEPVDDRGKQLPPPKLLREERNV